MAKQSLASAYVQIIPSADGISGSLAEALGGEAATAGKSSGASLGASLVSSLKGFLAAAGIGAMLKSAFTGGTEFETAIAKVGTIADTAKVPLDELKRQISDVSGTMGIEGVNLAEATYQAISASVATEDAVAFAAKASKLAAAGFTSESSAVDILTTALNAYGLGADEAGHVSDVLLTTQNLGKTSVDELSSSMGKVIPLASAYNVSLENLSSGLAIMTANGIATAEATTYTKSMLNELGDTGSDVSKILQNETGQSFAQLMDSGASLGDVLQILYDSVDGDSTAFAGLWSSVEAGTGALSLADAGAEKFNDVLGQMQADSNLTETAYATMTDTMQHSMDLLQTSAQNLGIALFDSVSGQLGSAVDLASGYLQTLTDSFQSGGLAGLAEGLGSIFMDLATNVGPQLLQSGIEMINQLGQGLVTGIPNLLSTALPMVADLASGLRENAGQLVDSGIQFILNMAQGLMDGLPTMIEYIPGIVSDIAGIINDNAPKLLMAGIQLIITLGKGLINAIPALVANLPQIIQAIVDVITAFNWINLGGKIITFFGNGIKNMAGFVASSVKGLMEQPIAFIKGLPQQFMGWGKDMIQGLIDGITGMIGNVAGAIGSVADKIASIIHFSRPDEGPLRNYEQWMPDFMGGLADGIRGNLWQVEDAVQSLAGAVAAPIQANLAAGAAAPVLADTAAVSPAQGQTITINVYGAPGQDINKLADVIEARLSWKMERRKESFA